MNFRAAAFKLVAEPIAELARDAASRSDFELCERALQIIREPCRLAEIVSAVEEDVLGPYEDAFNNLSKAISQESWKGIQREKGSVKANEKACSVALTRFKQEVVHRFGDFIATADSDSVPGLRVTEACADFLVNIGTALTWADQWADSEKLLTQAIRLLSPENPGREGAEIQLTVRIDESRRISVDAFLPHTGEPFSGEIYLPEREQPDPNEQVRQLSASIQSSNFAAAEKATHLRKELEDLDLDAAERGGS